MCEKSVGMDDGVSEPVCHSVNQMLTVNVCLAPRTNQGRSEFALHCLKPACLLVLLSWT